MVAPHFLAMAGTMPGDFLSLKEGYNPCSLPPHALRHIPFPHLLLLVLLLSWEWGDAGLHGGWAQPRTVAVGK